MPIRTPHWPSTGAGAPLLVAQMRGKCLLRQAPSQDGGFGADLGSDSARPAR